MVSRDEQIDKIDIEEYINNIKITDSTLTGKDNLLDIRRLSNLFTIKKDKVTLIVKGHDAFWANLRVGLKQKGDPIYRSAKNIVLAYKYLYMNNYQKNQLYNFFDSRGFYYRYEIFSQRSGLTVKTLKNYSDYLGTERFEANISACLKMIKTFSHSRF